MSVTMASGLRLVASTAGSCEVRVRVRVRAKVTGAHSMLRVAPTSKVTLISEFSLF